jgi:hypothetical protein
MADILFLIKQFLVYAGWWVLPLLFLFVLRSRYKKYPIECVIYEKRGENLVHTRDMAGRFTHPVTCYRLKTAKDSVPIPDYDWILQCMYKPTNIFEKIQNLLCGRVGTITLFKYGSKQYKPIRVKIGDKTVRKFQEIKDKKGNAVYGYHYVPVNVKQSMSQLNFDVIDWDDINHLTQELRAIAMRRSPAKAWIEKWGTMVGIGVIGMVIIITVVMGYRFIMDAGDRYIASARDYAKDIVSEAEQSNAPVEAPDVPFDFGIGD